MSGASGVPTLQLVGGPTALIPYGGSVTVTAVPGDHGPPEVAAVNGPVIGFVLRAEGLPRVYVSGDNASVDVVRAVARAHGPFDVAVLFAGAAQVPERWGDDAPLTLTPEAAVLSALELAAAAIVPIHQDGWGHFTADAGDLEAAFVDAGLSARLRSLLPGETIDLG